MKSLIMYQVSLGLTVTHLHIGEDLRLLCVRAVVGLVQVAHGSAVEVDGVTHAHVHALVVPHEGRALATEIDQGCL